MADFVERPATREADLHSRILSVEPGEFLLLAIQMEYFAAATPDSGNSE